MNKLTEKKREAMQELKTNSPDTLKFITEVSANFGKPSEVTIYINKKLFIFNEDKS